MLDPKYLTMRSELNWERKDCSLCNNLERESSVDLTAKSSPEVEAMAREMVAEAPRPMVGPLVQSIGVMIERDSGEEGFRT